jgi:hypothetical protein
LKQTKHIDSYYFEVIFEYTLLKISEEDNERGENEDEQDKCSPSFMILCK